MKKKLFFAYLLLFSWASISKAEITGSWQYVGFTYQGHRYERPDPNLHVIFDFSTSELLSLKWHRDNDNTFCHRLSFYEIEQSQLRQKIIWVDPENSMSCSSDLDMQLGRESENKIELNANELHLYLELNGEDFIYILQKK